MPDQNDIKIAKLETEVEFLKDRLHKAENKITDLEGAVTVYQTASVQVKTKLDQIYHALIGDEMGNAGVVKRLANVETVIEWISHKKSYVWGIIATLGTAIGVVIWGLEKLMDILK